MISATFGVYLSQKALALDFCYGYGQELTSIIQEYNEIDEEIASFGKVMVQMSILITFLFVNGTLFLYGFIFIHLFKTNKINKVGKQQVMNLISKSIYFYQQTTFERFVNRYHKITNEDKWNHYGGASGSIYNRFHLCDALFCTVLWLWAHWTCSNDIHLDLYSC